jgi:hypothetical protein
MSIQGRYFVCCLTTLALHPLTYNRLRLGLQSYFVVCGCVCKLQIETVGFVVYLHPSVRKHERLRYHRTDLEGISYWEILLKICENFRFCWKKGKKYQALHIFL